MEAKKYQAFWRGAIILTIASFVTKVLSAFYRIPYQNIAGDIGFYIYQQIYPFYGFCLILATYGFPVIISKMVAERLERGKQKRSRRNYLCIFLVLIRDWFYRLLYTVFWGRNNCGSYGRYTLR